MKRIGLLLTIIWLIAGNMQAQHNKGYGFTYTIKVPAVKKEVLMDSTLSWVRSTLVNPKFELRNVNEKDDFITGRGAYTSDSGTSNFDLTIYFKDNVVDVVADNVIYSQIGRQGKAERTQGSPKAKTKAYLTKLSYSLEQHLTKPQTSAQR